MNDKFNNYGHYMRQPFVCDFFSDKVNYFFSLIYFKKCTVHILRTVAYHEHLVPMTITMNYNESMNIWARIVSTTNQVLSSNLLINAF